MTRTTLAFPDDDYTDYAEYVVKKICGNKKNREKAILLSKKLKKYYY